jgi:D-inositol-3-phosphate glycosyltransferase
MISMHTSPVAQPGSADSGGLNVTVLELAQQLAERGIEVALVTRALTQPRRVEIGPGVTVHSLSAGGSGSILKSHLPDVTDEFGEAFAHLARDSQFDVIHSHYWLSGIAALPASIELAVPLVQSFHTLAAMTSAATDAPPESATRLHSEAYLAGQADALVAASSAEAASLIDLVGAPADRTWIVPPGVDCNRFAPTSIPEHAAVRRNLRLDPQRPIVVIAGRVQPLKGHELAVRALGELRAVRGWAPLLVVVGEATPGELPFVTMLQALSRDLGVEGDVAFVGALERDALAGLLAAASVTIVPSFSETFGLVALESAACGTPVIGYRTGGLSESIAEGVSGVLLGTRDARYWATEIAVMIENVNRRDALAVTARQHAERFTWSRAADRLLDVYRDVAR